MSYNPIVIGGGTEAAAQRVTIANDSTGVLSVDDNGGSITVDGTITEASGSAIKTSVELIDDTVYTDGSGTVTKGIAILGQDGTNPQAIKTDSSGELQVDVLTMPTVTVNSHAVTNAGTFAVQVDGSALTSLQLIDDAIYAEDVASQAADKGVQVLTVRKDTAAATSGTDGDYQPPVSNARGATWVAIEDGAGGQITSFGGGTQYTEDAAAAANPVGTAPILVRTDTPATQVSADGDNIAQRGTNYGAAYVQLVTSAGAYIDSVGGGTQYTEDAAAAANPTGTALIGVRADSLAGVTSADGDNVAARMTDKGELYVKHVDSLPVTDNGGSLTVDGTVAATQSGTWNVTNVSGTVSLPTGASTLAEQQSQTTHLATIAGDTTDIEAAVELIDDTVATLGTTTYSEATTKGLIVGAVRRDADTTLVDTTNEVTPLQVDANGRLKVEAFSGETLPVSLTSTTITGTVAVTQSGTWDEVGINDSGNSITVDNGGTFAVQESGSALTALQLIDNIVHTEDEASSDGHSGVLMLARRTATPANTSGADLDYEVPQMSAGRLWTSATIDAALPAGTNAIGKLAANSGVDIGDVDVTSIPGTGVEDAAETAGGTLLMAGTVRRDTQASSAGTSGDNATLNTDSTGGLWIAGNAIEDAAETAGGALVMAGAVRRDTAASSSGTSGDNSTLNVDALGKIWTTGSYSEDTAHTAADTLVAVATRRIDTAASSSGTSGDYSTLDTSAEGAVWSTLTPTTTSGCSIFRSLDIDETEEDVKTSAGNLYGYFCYNAAASARFLKFYNATAATVTVGMTTPVLTFPLPAGAAANVSFAYPIYFSSAICAAATTGVADADTGAPAANDCVINIFYK